MLGWVARLQRSMIAVWKAQIRYFYLPPSHEQETCLSFRIFHEDCVPQITFTLARVLTVEKRMLFGECRASVTAYIGQQSHAETFTGNRGTVGSLRKSEVHLLKAWSGNLELNLLPLVNAGLLMHQLKCSEIIGLLLSQVWAPQGDKRPPFIPAWFHHVQPLASIQSLN